MDTANPNNVNSYFAPKPILGGKSTFRYTFDHFRSPERREERRAALRAKHGDPAWYKWAWINYWLFIHLPGV